MDTNLGYMGGNIESDPPTKINVLTCLEKNEKKNQCTRIPSLEVLRPSYVIFINTIREGRRKYQSQASQALL
jgi:hypothetical protein